VLVFVNCVQQTGAHYWQTSLNIQDKCSVLTLFVSSTSRHENVGETF